MAEFSGKSRLLFVSNLFPSQDQPYRGLDNATVLHQLSDRWDIRVLGIRPTLPWQPALWQPRAVDQPFEPRYVRTPYLPKIGSRVNHRWLTNALRGPMEALHREFPFEAVLSSWIYPDSCAVASLAQERGFPFVAIAQGSDVHQYLRHPVRRGIITAALPRAAAVITRSGELARLLHEAGLDRTRLHAVYNGIDFEVFQPGDAAEARQALRLPAAGRIILFVGNFYPIKNPLGLIAAHARLADQECHLVMVGGGPLEKAARSLARRLGTSERVIFRGRLDAPAVARHMQAADLLALPSDNEGVPNVILEAFACGRPVVASRVGGIAEVHHGSYLGRLVAPRDPDALADGLAEVLRAPAESTRIREHALQFSWERASARYDQLLVQALGRPAAGVSA